MKKLNVLIAILVILFMISASAYADCRGCCSGHGGTVCIDGVTLCADGTEMSDKCKAKCEKCAAMSKPIAIRGNTSVQSFNKAKKTLLRKVYKDHHKTFYCGCTFTDKKQVIHDNGYKPKKKWKRAHRLEWEHVLNRLRYM